MDGHTMVIKPKGVCGVFFLEFKFLLGAFFRFFLIVPQSLVGVFLYFKLGLSAFSFFS